ncbi:hypothetical protein B0J17DRAFT_628432 [Rhizoctonia solani]|nr:hypothetical protein B0J17DRAFT_628432 [Rhizoctonia solani]
MHFSILSIAFTFLATSILTLAAPATPTGLVPAVALPAGVKLYDATAGYNATHGLPYDKKVHVPLTERDLQARQAYTGDATYYHAGLRAWVPNVAALMVTENMSLHSMHHANWNIRCPGCGYGLLDLTPSLFQAFTSLDVGRVSVNGKEKILRDKNDVKGSGPSFQDECSVSNK